jgi:hypothetical protein
MTCPVVLVPFGLVSGYHTPSCSADWGGAKALEKTGTWVLPTTVLPSITSSRTMGVLASPASL